ncbi:helix-turn-helix transcriptional regulator [Brooklawnia cerclae]|uniref:MerR family transcriptional regulator/heat shock protein HspR n=1 Tax=Brooklawnia cerclae TaxID=349934 RepID=A0ABX0SNM4_9ACTN|nr:helix-turn-helix transcriptional regulator [Brooklawnia cerclae]NIH58371.1 MerR family transcriptional regulator/heat shock protein HspR [Brooklawnia cerclae]
MNTSERLPQLMDPDAPAFSISVAAALADMHPQTLRTYDRLGLVVPSRARGGGRRYSPRDVGKLRLIQHLSHEEGINLNGIRRIIDLQSELDETRHRLDELASLVRQFAEQRETMAPRVFAAGSSGYVAQGRRPRRPLALPGS